MADYTLVRKSRNTISTFVHILMNVVLGLVSIFATALTGSWAIGVILVLVSKWRIFAVRPRYWLLNIKSNLVDLIVGLSFVLIAYCSGTVIMPVHWLLAVGYIAWLTILKPKSSEPAAEAQSLVAVFLGITATVLLTANYNSSIIVIMAFIIGYAASRHTLIQSDDDNFSLITLVCGLISAEIAWLCHSWLIVYTFSGTGIIIPQLSIILSVFAFVFTRVHRSIIKHDGKLKFNDVVVPIIFSMVVIAVIMIWFSKPIFDV